MLCVGFGYFGRIRFKSSISDCRRIGPGSGFSINTMIRMQKFELLFVNIFWLNIWKSRIVIFLARARIWIILEVRIRIRFSWGSGPNSVYSSVSYTSQIFLKVESGFGLFLRVESGQSQPYGPDLVNFNVDPDPVNLNTYPDPFNLKPDPKLCLELYSVWGPSRIQFKLPGVV